MAKVVLGSALARWRQDMRDPAELTIEVPATRLLEALDGAFAVWPELRGYVLDDHGKLRHHVAVFVDGVALADKRELGLPLVPGSEVYLMQALSGG